MRNILLKSFSSIFIIFIFKAYSFCQNSDIIEKEQSCYYEDLVLSTDRSLYVAGEKIWFEVNCFDNQRNGDTLLSKIVYLELYDSKKNRISKGKFRINDNIAYGHLIIPKELTTGNYIIRAYTKYLRNFDPLSYPSCLISVINPNKAPISTKRAIDDITISPDGGKLIGGVSSRLAIRINYLLNKKILKASIVDEQDNELLSFKPYSNGLSLLDFKPVYNTQYFLKLELKEDSIIKPLPVVHKSGLILNSEIKKDILEVMLDDSDGFKNHEKEKFRLQMKTHYLHSLSETQIKPREKVNVPLKTIPQGLIFLVLKNDRNEVLKIIPRYVLSSLRESNENIEIVTNKKSYEPRELIELQLNSRKNGSIERNCLISISKKGTNNYSSEDLPVQVLYGPMFLNNYLRKISLQNDNLIEQVEASLILFSEIYNSEKFINNIQKRNTIEWLPEIRDISLSGKVINKFSDQPQSGRLIYATVFDRNNQIHLCKTREDGSFLFSLGHLTGIQNLCVSLKEETDTDQYILVNNDFSNDFPFIQNIPFFYDSTKTKLVEELIINAQASSEFNYQLENILEHTKYEPLLTEDPLKIIWLKDFIKLPTMSDVFEEIIPFVFQRKKNDQYKLRLYNEFDKIYYDDPLVMVDGVPVSNINEVMLIDPKDVEKISINNRPYFLGENEINGIIRIDTKTNNFAGIKFSDEYVFLEYETVTPSSSPTFPSYKKNKSKRIPGFRNLLYWNSHFDLTQKNQNIQFHAGDNSGEFDVLVKGFDQKGNLFFGHTVLKINRAISKK